QILNSNDQNSKRRFSPEIGFDWVRFFWAVSGSFAVSPCYYRVNGVKEMLRLGLFREIALSPDGSGFRFAQYPVGGIQ
ncbi:MAG: hypothetical protein KAR47_02480, partial [Planctomycetes bacterium]|nr:hypothetical protein [Planctomycetota bacterium]